MFNLHIINTIELKNHLSYAFYDLLNGFKRYSDLAKQQGFKIYYYEDATLEQASLSNERIDGVFTIWNNGLEKYDYKNEFKIASFVDDFHWWNENILNSRLNFFSNADVLFTPYYRTFMNYQIYQSYYGFLKDKFHSLFWWAPDHCFTLNKPWEERTEKILMSGAHGKWYNFREIILLTDNQLLKKLPMCGRGPNFSHPYHWVKYLNYISLFKGGICTSANPISTNYDESLIHPLDYTLKKNFEIIGCGALGFLETTDDFKELGLIPYTHYIPITKNDFESKFDYIFKQDGMKIANEGRELLRQKHTTKHRILSILDILKKEWNV